MGSWCRGVEDVCLNGRMNSLLPAVSEQEVSLLKLTPAYPVLLRYLPGFVDYERLSLSDVGSAAEKLPSPMFLFYHNLDAHGARFDANCRIRNLRDLQFEETMDADELTFYAHTLSCLNRELVRVVDAIVERHPEAIIVIQSDHGLTTLPEWGKMADWTAEDLKARFGILNMIRLPQKCQGSIYP